jgi:hypothetical protein
VPARASNAPTSGLPVVTLHVPPASSPTIKSDKISKALGTVLHTGTVIPPVPALGGADTSRVWVEELAQPKGGNMLRLKVIS